MTRLWIRADGSRTLGLGHIMRTVALAEAATGRSMPTRFVLARDEVAEAALARRGCDVVSLPDDRAAWLDAVAPHDIVVFDGYHFGREHHRAARATGAAVAAVADEGGGAFDVDVLVDQNAPHGRRYELPDDGIVLAGPRYALLRREFTDRAERRRDADAAMPVTLVLTFGATDAANVTGAVLDVVRAVASFDRVMLVVGPGAPTPTVAAPSLEVVRDPASIADVFAGADAAIAAAGSTTWELLALGVAAGLIQVAPNQHVVVETAVQAGAALAVGGPADIPERLPQVLAELREPSVRGRLSRAGADLVDGNGAQRVLDVLLGLVSDRVR